MHAYRVIDRGFHVGAGALMLVSIAQAMERQHKLELVGKTERGSAYGLVRAKEMQAFKVGELLGLTDPPKGQLHMVEELAAGGKKDGPEAGLRKAVAEFHAAAEASERAREAALEQADKVRAAEQLAAAEAAAVALWTEEWKATEAARKDFPKVADYIAARKKESTTQAAS